MLSILIPVYNYSVVRLVCELHRQAEQLFIDFEIIVMEDGSSERLEENRQIDELSFCKYIVLEKNIGRSGIRNRLADMAKYGHLLFLDCDAEVCSAYFVEKYVSFCREESVVVGGTAYDENFNDPDYSLRLKYGRLREARPATLRNKLELNGKSNFSAFNFFIAKSIFNRIRFDETISGYGHEDTLFGHQIHELGFTVFHIDNPLIHKGLDNNQVFMSKTEEGIRNLYFLFQTGRYPFLAKESSLLNSFLTLKKMSLIDFFSWLYQIFRHPLYTNLCSSNPSLFLFDLYKLLYFCHYSKKMTR
jgi:glycosyltransferase involved in cell wall biosynthesis